MSAGLKTNDLRAKPMYVKCVLQNGTRITCTYITKDFRIT